MPFLRTKRILPLLLLLLWIPAKAEIPEIKCPGLTTHEMGFCASQKWEESTQALQEKLNPATFEKWEKAIQEVCAAAYAPYREGTIYTQMVIGCDDRLNRALLEEFRGLGERNRQEGP